MSSIKLQVSQYYYEHDCTASMRIQYPFWFGRADKETDTETDRIRWAQYPFWYSRVMMTMMTAFSTALFSTLEHTHCARM